MIVNSQFPDQGEQCTIQRAIRTGNSLRDSVHYHFRIIGAVGILLLPISAPVSAQSSPPEPGQNAASKTVTYSAGDTKVAIQVRVLGAHDAPLQQQALVSIYAKGKSTPVRTAYTK